jgi:hypothetical protein
MAELRSEQAIEVPVTRDRRSGGLNVGTLLLAGGIGYVLLKTFLLEERVNDLTVLMKRRSASESETCRRAPIRQPEYETSDDDDDEEEEEEEEEEVVIEEQPREVPPPPAEPATREVVATSAFVTTRQRRSGSELHREGSRERASTREA